MKVFIDIGHPAHFHYLKNLAFIIKEKGGGIFISARDKDVTHKLIEHAGLDFYNRGKGEKNVLSKILYMLKTDYQLYKLAKEFQPDLFLSAGSPYAAQVSRLLSKPHISLSDTENAGLNQLAYRPFTDAVLTPSVYMKEDFKTQVKFDGYLELCYLHPNFFRPNKDILDILGVRDDEKYLIVRFVSWEAAHDYGHKGLSNSYKMKLVNELSKYGRVFISSESEIPDELKSHAVDIPVHRMHDALAFAHLFYGESATMASESAVLGTPAIYHDDVGRGYTFDLEKNYGIVYNFSESEEDQGKGLKKAVEILKQKNVKDSYLKKREKMLADKIDVTSFLEWFIYNYPESFNQIKKNPEIQTRFKIKADV